MPLTACAISEILRITIRPSYMDLVQPDLKCDPFSIGAFVLLRLRYTDFVFSSLLLMCAWHILLDRNNSGHSPNSFDINPNTFGIIRNSV